MRTESRLVIRGRRRARRSAPQRCLAEPSLARLVEGVERAVRHRAPRRHRRRTRADVVHHLRRPPERRAREPGRMLRDDGQAAAHAIAVALDPVRRGPPVAIARVAVHLGFLRRHVDVVGARAPGVAAGLADPFPEDDAEVDAHGHERAIEDEVPDGDGGDRGHRARRHRGRRRPSSRAWTREERHRRRDRGPEQEQVRPQPDGEAQHRSREQRTDDRHPPPARHRHEQDEREQHGDHADDVRGQERGVVREVRKERGQETGADRAAPADQRVREQEHEHGHERVQHVLHELGGEEAAAQQAR